MPPLSSSLRLGTRGSPLARWQSDHIAARLVAAGIPVIVEEILTRGDQVLDVPLWQVEGKAFFTRELDQALLDGRIDLAVHSLKDVPTRLPEGLVVAAVPARETPLDAFIAHPTFEGGIEDVPEGAVLATSSLRRKALLLAWRPDLQIVSVRGNVDTRLRKLDESAWHGMVLAAAGLVRLGLETRIRTRLDPGWMLPAVGQGALGIVCADRNGLPEQMRRLLSDPHTEIATRAERAFLRRLEGGCQIPVGALAYHTPAGFILEGCVAALDGAVVFRHQLLFDERHPDEAGQNLAEHLLAAGANDLLRELRS